MELVEPVWDRLACMLDFRLFFLVAVKGTLLIQHISHLYSIFMELVEPVSYWRAFMLFFCVWLQKAHFISSLK
jgi:hypothetical protein